MQFPKYLMLAKLVDVCKPIAYRNFRISAMWLTRFCFWLKMASSDLIFGQGSLSFNSSLLNILINQTDQGLHQSSIAYI